MNNGMIVGFRDARVYSGDETRETATAWVWEGLMS